MFVINSMKDLNFIGFCNFYCIFSISNVQLLSKSIFPLFDVSVSCTCQNNNSL